jgi:hypothetical protein
MPSFVLLTQVRPGAGMRPIWINLDLVVSMMDVHADDRTTFTVLMLEDGAELRVDEPALTVLKKVGRKR